MSVEELAAWRAEGRDFVLLDVREPAEIRLASIPGSESMPMREVPVRAGTLSKERAVAVICHHGGRSQRVASFLKAQGFARVFNVEGGIDAYSARIDPTIPRY